MPWYGLPRGSADDSYRTVGRAGSVIEPREIGISFRGGRAVSSSWVWCRLEFNVLILSEKKAKSGPRVGTQATMMETFSSTLEGFVSECW